MSEELNAYEAETSSADAWREYYEGLAVPIRCEWPGCREEMPDFDMLCEKHELESLWDDMPDSPESARRFLERCISHLQEPKRWTTQEIEAGLILDWAWFQTQALDVAAQPVVALLNEVPSLD